MWKKLTFRLIFCGFLFAGFMSGHAEENKKKQNKKSGGGLMQQFWKLNLTYEQKQKMRDILKQMRDDMQAMFGKTKEGDKKNTAPRDVQRAAKEKIMRDAYDRALALLTPEQRLKLIDKTSDNENIIKDKDAGKTISLELLKEIGETAPKASSKSKLPPNFIDKLAKPVEDICSDETFVRRIYVDLIGQTPSVEQVLSFLKDNRKDKRARLVDELMETPSYADYQTMHWCDTLRVKAEFPIKLWPNGAAVYHRWIRSAIMKNMPYDNFAYELLTGSGSNFRSPPANFYRAVQANDPYSLAEAVTLTFMASRLASWTPEKKKEIQKFFGNVAYKSTNEWKEEIVYWDRKKPKSSRALLPDGTEVRLSSKRDPRRVFADWLVNDGNKWFAKAAVNRVWFWLNGTGIVHEPDNFHPKNPPTNPELLEALADKFIESGYDLKKLYKMIVCSRTYQQKAPGYALRPLDAEILQDTLCRIFGTQVKYSSDVPEPFTFYPPETPSTAIPDGTITSKFLMTFGRPSRDTGRESDRSQSVTEEQRVYFINSTEINTWITKSFILRVLPLDEAHRKTSLQYLWLNVLSRYPREEEIERAAEVLSNKEVPQITSVQDLCWMLINTNEFSARH